MITKKQIKIAFPYIAKLKIPVRFEGMSHILIDDLAKVLTTKQLKQFHNYFGIQTCFLRKDGRGGLYLHDVEDVLVRIFENKLIGTQKYFD